MTRMRKGARNPRPRVRDVAGLKEEIWTGMERKRSNRTAGNADARCIAVEAVAALQRELMGGPREVMGVAPILTDGVPLKRGIVCFPGQLTISVAKTTLDLRLTLRQEGGSYTTRRERGTTQRGKVPERVRPAESHLIPSIKGRDLMGKRRQSSCMSSAGCNPRIGISIGRITS